MADFIGQLRGKEKERERGRGRRGEGRERERDPILYYMQRVNYEILRNCFMW